MNTRSTTADMPNRVRAVLIGPSAKMYKGGIAQFTDALAEKLANRCELRYFSWYQAYPSFLIRRNFRDEVSKTRFGRVAAEYVLGYMNPLSWYRCARKIRSFTPDIVCITWIHPVHAPVFFCLIQYLKRITKAEIVFLCHNVLPHERFLGSAFLSKATLRCANRLVVHSRAEAEQARSFVGQREITSLFLPLFNFFPASSEDVRLAKGNDPATLLFFGAIRPYKGLDILLRAMPLVLERYPDTRLRIVGEIFYPRSRKKQASSWTNPLLLIDELGLESHVETDLRYVPNEDIPKIFAAADVAVFPYRSATQSGTIPLAYSYGVPVIATRLAGFEDIVAEGHSGYLAKPDSPEDLAEAIIRFRESPISAESVSEFASRLSWERYVHGLIEHQSMTREELRTGPSDSKTN